MDAKIIFLFYITTIHSYNIDTNFPLVYSDKGARKAEEGNSQVPGQSYFGYSVLLNHESVNDTSWLIVGAPKGNYARRAKNDSEHPREPGVVYRLTLTGLVEEICPSRIDEEEGFLEQVHMKMLVKKQHGWFGSAIAVERNLGILTICAPRTVMTIFDRVLNHSFDTMHGMCYSGSISSNTVFIENKDAVGYDFRSPFWFNPLHGFSVHYGSNQHTQKERSLSRIIGRPKHEGYGTVSLLQSLKKMKSAELPQNDPLTQFGYSVTSGCFLTKDQLLFASGAPGWHYTGQVGILDPSSSLVATLRGSEIGEFFGASLAAGDVDQDGLDDLIIGAPHWGMDNGRVYIYYGRSKGPLDAGTILEGATEDAQFGYALACGDLDKDGYADVIVGAPWEGNGVIYVYNGNGRLKDEGTLRASQRISPLELSTRVHLYRGLATFGFSISEPLDIDGNGFPDVAIGAYSSGNAVLLRGKPVGEVSINVTAYPETLRRSTETFVIETCLRHSGYRLENTQAVRVTVIIDESYARTKPKALSFTTLSSAIGSCVRNTINISESIQDFIEPLSVVARHEFAPSGEPAEAFCKACPTESAGNELDAARLSVPFDIGCGADEICIANISAVLLFRDVLENNAWIIGSGDISLEATLENDAEPAYLSSVTFILPRGIVLRSLLPYCQEDRIGSSVTVACTLGNPFEDGEKKSIRLDLDMRHLTNGSLHGHTLRFVLRIKTRSANVGIEESSVSLALRSELSLALNGKANEENYYFSVPQDEAPNISFQHTYQILKFGPTSIDKARLVVNVPTGLRGAIPMVHLYRPQLYVSGTLHDCSSRNIVFLRAPDSGYEGSPSDGIDLGAHVAGRAVLAEHRAPDKRDAYGAIEADEGNASMAVPVRERQDGPKASEAATLNVEHLNCSDENAICSTILCDLSVLKTPQDVGKLTMRFALNLASLADAHSEGGRLVKFSTEAYAEILEPAKRDNADETWSTTQLTTSFYVTPKTQRLQLWIVLVSILVGLILFCVFVAILSRLGFFKRTKKEEVDALRTSSPANA
ncbi:hypothetical protein KM043_000447 [Ampulex compressa]|nr:hypothetical protein KM043_000447 [Ampulex compressa]